DVAIESEYLVDAGDDLVSDRVSWRGHKGVSNKRGRFYHATSPREQAQAVLCTPCTVGVAAIAPALTEARHAA
ncbi:hypothetical protein AB4144_16200, partial [Rhizobiaceae sp. 2RAB30]